MFPKAQPAWSVCYSGLVRVKHPPDQHVTPQDEAHVDESAALENQRNLHH